MLFRTEIEPLRLQGLLSHTTPLFLMGSCFTDHVGRRLADDLFHVMANPFGTVYNPASMHALLSRVATDSTFSPDELVSAGGRYHSMLCHSVMSTPTPDGTTANLNRALAATRDFIGRASAAVVTSGTARVFRLRQSGDIVGNCHKLHPDTFTRRLLSVDAAADELQGCVDNLTAINPGIKVFFTVSPIRHVADGLHGNQLSKATLLLAIDRICAANPDRCIYFPAYEALVDDLRDYRFYAADMKHPSEVAADYVYDLFSSSFFTPSTVATAIKARKWTARLRHRHTDPEAGRIFGEATASLGRSLAESHPELADIIKTHLSTIR